MSISDWSSDVCSSDLHAAAGARPILAGVRALWRRAHPIWTALSSDTNRPAPDPSLAGTTGVPPAHSRSARHRRPSRQESRRSEEHTSELQSLMRLSYAVFCLKKKNTKNNE